MLVVDLDGAVIGERAYRLLLSTLVGVLLQTGIPSIEFIVADEFDLRDEGLGELHTSLVTLERHVDRHHEVGNLGVADNSAFDERHKHLWHHDHLLAQDIELTPIDIDITFGKFDIVAHICL